jgi:hypothetical protein
LVRRLRGSFGEGVIPNDFDSNKKKKFVHDCRFYLWDDPFLYKRGVDGLVRRCVPEEEQRDVLVMIQIMEDTSVVTEQRPKFFNQAYIGPHCS